MASRFMTMFPERKATGARKAAPSGGAAGRASGVKTGARAGAGFPSVTGAGGTKGFGPFERKAVGA